MVIAQLLVEQSQQLAAQEQEIDLLQKENAQLQRKLAWFQRQLFGRKSEKRLFDSPLQDNFDELLGNMTELLTTSEAVIDVPAHQRKKKSYDGTPDDSGLRFNENQVPVKEIILSAPELKGPHADNFEIIRYENTYRLAQLPASYEILKYARPVLKNKLDQTLKTVAAPDNVFGKSFADVSFVVGMLVDKFVYHLPLYRQHQRLKASYVEISRATLTHLVEKAALLLEPVAKAVLASILESALIAMDETPTKAGRKKQKGAKHGEMRQGWYWPLYGDRDEVYFHFSSSRGAQVVHDLLAGFEGTLLSDGYSAYANYAASVENSTHALCWVHLRRHIERALDDEPILANQALDLIGGLYAHEEHIRKKGLKDSEKLAYRGEHSKDIVDRFFKWCTQHVDRPDLVATESPLLDGIKYALKREKGLRVFLEDPDVPMDTNHLERTLRVIPTGKRNWLFNWTELGAHYTGIIQTLMCSCKLQRIDPYVYLIDVLQRVERHPARQVSDLIPRNWKEKFGDCPLKSDIAKV